MHIVFMLLAFSSLASVFWMPIFHDLEGFLNPISCLVFAFAGASLVMALFWRSTLRRAAAWFALLMLGQGLSLQLINAGPTVHYQHFRLDWAEATHRDILFFGLLLIQAVLVAWAVKPHLRTILDWIQNHLGNFRALFIFLCLVIFYVFPSREIGFFALELVFASILVSTQLATLLLGIFSIPRPALARLTKPINRFLSGSDRPGIFGTNIDRLVVVCAVWTITISLLLVIFSYERHPHVPDEFAYLFHANYFSHGHLSIPAPPVVEAVEAYLMDCNSVRCISPVPPGWPAMLSVGSYFGVPWLVNPLLSGVNIVLLFLLLLRLYDRRTARLGVLLLSVSPWYLYVSMSFMTHTFSLTCALAAGLFVVQLKNQKHAIWAVLAGAAIGILSLTRPLEGLMVASVLGLATLFIRGKGFRFGPVVYLTLSTIIVSAVVFPYNKSMTGNPFKFPIMAYTDRVLGPGVNSLGFGPDKGTKWGGLDPFPGHGLPDVIVNALLNIDAMNIETFGWITGSLVLILFFLAARSPRRLNTVDKWMLLFVVVIFALQSLYWFSGGPDFGARYYYLAIIPLIALTARASFFFSHSVNSSTLIKDQGITTVFIALLVLCISSLINFVPWRAIDKYHHYRGMRPDIRVLVEKNKIGKSLLLINGKEHPDLNSALVYSDLNPYGNGPVIAWNKNPEVRRRLLEAYHDRKVWVIDGPSITGSGYRILMGPVTASKLLQ